MGYANSLPLISVATVTHAGASHTLNVAEYHQGALYTRILAMSGTGARLYLRWDESPDEAHFLPIVSGATGLRATGLSVLPIARVGLFGRCGYRVGGTTPAIRFETWLVLKASR
jgi:hypothetical protein